MKGMYDLSQRRIGHVAGGPHEFVLLGRDPIDGILGKIGRLAALIHPLPVLIEADRPQVLAEAPETVHVTIANPAPIDKLNAKLEGALRFAHELLLIQPDDFVEQLDHRDRGFANADDAYVVRFDDANLVLAPEHLGQCRGRHPAGGATANNDDIPQLGVPDFWHRSAFLTRKGPGRTSRPGP